MHLGDLFHKIRFASMKLKQLCALLTKYDAILRNDFETIFKIVTTPGFQSDKFNMNQRHAKWNENAIIECDRASSNGYLTEFVYLDMVEETKFSTNKSLLLGSFMCEKIGIGDTSSISALDDDWPVDIEFIEIDVLGEDADSKILLNMKAKLQSKINTIQLPQPLLIRSDYFYIIRVKPFPKEYRYYSKELKTQVEVKDGVEIKFYSDFTWRINGIEKVVGLFPKLNFNRV